MTRTGTSYRGQPLVALLLLVGGWVAMRAITLTFDMSASAATDRPAVAVAGPSKASTTGAPAAAFEPERASARRFGSMPVYPVRMAMPLSTGPSEQRPYEQAPAKPILSAAANVELSDPALTTASVARQETPAPAGIPARAIFVPSVAPSRWSGDAWLLVRRGGAERSTAGFAPATYGASQAGAVIRYRLDPASERRPSAYLRGSAALDGFREEEVALGLSARPIAGFPIVAAVEARVNRQAAGTRVRPAAFAYTELPAVKLPLGAHAEIYGQAGYVGGNFATAFADGQVRADRKVVRLGDAELRTGGGIWGGAQKGASRLDVGPSATLSLPIGNSAGARIEADWRFRVSGNAAPSSGPTLTLSAGF